MNSNNRSCSVNGKILTAIIIVISFIVIVIGLLCYCVILHKENETFLGFVRTYRTMTQLENVKQALERELLAVQKANPNLMAFPRQDDGQKLEVEIEKLKASIAEIKQKLEACMPNIPLEDTNPTELPIVVVTTTSFTVSTEDPYPMVQHKHEEDKGLP